MTHTNHATSSKMYTFLEKPGSPYRSDSYMHTCALLDSREVVICIYVRAAPGAKTSLSTLRLSLTMLWLILSMSYHLCKQYHYHNEGSLRFKKGFLTRSAVSRRGARVTGHKSLHRVEDISKFGLGRKLSGYLGPKVTGRSNSSGSCRLDQRFPTPKAIPRERFSQKFGFETSR